MERLAVLKTYKIYIDGKFPRTESGRYYGLRNKKGKILANVCLSSRKDFKNAVVAARNAFVEWSTRSAFNRGQILYRIGEMLEGRREQFIEELVTQGLSKAAAKTEVDQSIDRLIYYAGWADKFQPIFSSVNPVTTPHYNFSVPEPMGVVALIAPENSGLLGLVSSIAAIITGGNTCVVLASEKLPLCSVTFGEVLATSDVPAGVVNILTGTSSELISQFSSHMDVNSLVYCNNSQKEIKLIQENCSLNVKRFFHWDKEWKSESSANPYLIMDLQEIKTTWHPIDGGFTGGAKY